MSLNSLLLGMGTTQGVDHWDTHAYQWPRITSPLRPSVQDIAIFSQEIELHASGPRGLLLGVTPELLDIKSDMIALDHNTTMVARAKADTTTITHGEWLNMPFSNASFDFVLGDGVLSMIEYTQHYERLFCELKRTLSPNGVLILRVYDIDAQKKTVSDVLMDARNRTIGSFHAFKWRFAMALVEERQQGPDIAVQDIYKAFQQYVPDRSLLSFETGWDVADIDTIDVYRNSTVLYSLTTLHMLRHMIMPYFEEITISYGDYEMAECCPIITFRARQNILSR